MERTDLCGEWSLSAITRAVGVRLPKCENTKHLSKTFCKRASGLKLKREKLQPLDKD